MKKLKLPIIKEEHPGPGRLSMDEYLNFVNFNIKYTIDIVKARKLKKAASINVPFALQ